MTDVPPVRRLPQGGAILGVLTAVTVAAFLWIAVGPWSGLALARASWLTTVLADLTSMLTSWQIARRLRPGDPARRFWLAGSACAATIGTGFIIQLVVTGPGDSLRATAVTSVLMGLSVAGMVVALLVHPLTTVNMRQRLCFWLDLGTVMVAVAGFGLYFTAGEVSDNVLELLSGPAVMLVGALAVARPLIYGQPPFSRPTGTLMIAAGIVGGLGTSDLSPFLAIGRANWVHCALALGSLGDCLVMLSVRIQLLAVNSDPQAVWKARRRPYSTLPYLAIAATYSLLVAALLAHGVTLRTWIVLAAAVASTALVVARQLTSFADNARLLVDLRDALRERDVLAAELHTMAFTDHLTGLANRALFRERLDAGLAHARRHHTNVVVMLIDLDDFKPVNDEFGHAAGDAVLVEVAHRLRACARETDVVARIGGDEFVILLCDLDLAAATQVGERVVTTVGEPCAIDGGLVRIGASVGLAADPTGARSAEELLHGADSAMYRAKCAGKGTVAVLGQPTVDQPMMAPPAPMAARP